MRRCFDLARLGAGRVSPNPMVGALLWHEGRIIGEGWHRRFGEAHAEANAVRAVSPDNQRLIPHSTLYCSLEPCFHHGKTPPCVDLILREKIPRVVVACTDPNPLVAGQSIAKLRAAGVEVTAGVLEAEGRALNRPFFQWIRTGRPYVILKWAQSRDGYLGRAGERTAISGPAALRLGHRWRAEADAIIVGATTAIVDNPRLDTRHYFGPSPLRIALDRGGKIPAAHHLLDDSAETWIFGPERPGVWTNTRFFPQKEAALIPLLLEKLAAARKAILLVEGGADTLQRFLDAGLWDEIRVLENVRFLSQGIPAPRVPEGAILLENRLLASDTLFQFARSI